MFRNREAIGGKSYRKSVLAVLGAMTFSVLQEASTQGLVESVIDRNHDAGIGEIIETVTETELKFKGDTVKFATPLPLDDSSGYKKNSEKTDEIPPHWQLQSNYTTDMNTPRFRAIDEAVRGVVAIREKELRPRPSAGERPARQGEADLMALLNHIERQIKQQQPQKPMTHQQFADLEQFKILMSIYLDEPSPALAEQIKVLASKVLVSKPSSRRY